ncbi:hypothetical protein DXG01_011569 [Tephrocybe rancida]|nr:hypothetical protein DXG01_011569 [Tephrocybe rancida]
MVKYYDSIPEFLFPWIAKQKMFWVATAPLTGEGLINVSPKGMTGSFHVVDANKVWYEDLTGSGIETVAHVRENGRITILFHAFEGPPRILRIYGKGTIYEFGTPEYDALLPLDQRKCGSRAVIMLDVFKTGTSCGDGIPFMEYKGERNGLMLYGYKSEMADIAAEAPLDLSTTEPPLPITGLKRYWRFHNNVSLDGLPGILFAYESRHKFITPEPIKKLKKNDESAPGRLVLRVGAGELKLVAAFLTGVMLTASYVKFMKPRGTLRHERHGLREFALFQNKESAHVVLHSRAAPAPIFLLSRVEAMSQRSGQQGFFKIDLSASPITPEQSTSTPPQFAVHSDIFQGRKPRVKKEKLKEVDADTVHPILDKIRLAIAELDESLSSVYTLVAEILTALLGYVVAADVSIVVVLVAGTIDVLCELLENLVAGLVGGLLANVVGLLGSVLHPLSGYDLNGVLAILLKVVVVL